MIIEGVEKQNDRYHIIYMVLCSKTFSMGEKHD